ncbi:hypothetical protein NIES37_18000 [Tolypothrix tenuis PCC 7101]|uniref:DUF6745 domain-containing protein n=1 Tax=Tolypothrix tenuis PCC 7101 TaxID=231146 RepID=A0A1Z4MWN6_9CYAN|nr:hypothetical protein [Aulosira sp. FACHB-113]BAY97853.1 hypothetical protein NIES37_18000 [Tolypothrix tenuis PCC 7101]BAZ71640.1 hypothetical protein NIES50_01840 [Aulosira laxa NIES-50]
MSNQEIKTLTPEQEALIPVYQQKWRKIALSTERIDREKASEAVKAAYDLIGEDEPEIIFFDSPYTAAKHFYFQGSYSELDYSDLLPQIREIFMCIVFNDIGNEDFKTDFDTDRQLWEIISNIEEISEREMRELEIGDDLPYEFESGHMQTDSICYECGWSDFCISELGFYKHSTWDIYQNILKNCGRIYAYKEACLICDRPTKLSFNNQNRLHAEGEPALEYVDGFKVYAYEGVRLPEKYGKVFANQWQATWLLEEGNAELRRVLIQGIGYKRICEELGAIELDSWQEYTLLRIDNYQEINRRGSTSLESMCLLKMICPSTGNIHILRVPPNITSAREAISWVNWGIDPEDFLVQT